MSLRNEQCRKVCRIIDDALANRPAERDSLIIAVQIAFETLERMSSSSPNCSESPNGWISCDERLPNDNDYRECMECLDGAVLYFTKNGTMGLGYHYESTKEWATTDDLRTDGNVIAWMPLPDPYQPKEDES